MSSSSSKAPQIQAKANDDIEKASSDSHSIHSREEEEEVEPELTEQEKHVASCASQSQTQIKPTLSRSSSAAYSLRKVPDGKRAGLLARFSLIYEAEEPKAYPRKLKWFITFNVALAAVAAPLGSAIILPALTDISHDFGSTPFITNLSVAFYMLSMSIFPLWWSSFSEASGRRAVYVFSFALFLLWNILAAVSSSISMFIVMRILSGGSSAAVQAVGAGTIADIWDVKERGRAMGIFYLGPLCGPLLAPLVGGALTQGLGWRSTQWFQVIFGGCTFLLMLLALPETHRVSSIQTEAEAEAEAAVGTSPPTTAEKEPGSALTRVSTAQSVALKSRKLAGVARRIFIDPLALIAYLRFPPVALCVYYASIAFGSLYFLNISIEQTFSRPPYNFSTIIVGLLYMFNSVGYLLASLLGGKWVDHIMARCARRAGRVSPSGKLIFHTEDRLRENIWTAALLMPASLLWYGWTAQYGIFWLAPMIANFFFGIGSMLLFGTVTTVLTELIPRKASSGVALNNFVRNIFSFAGTLLAEPLIGAIGNGWLFTILAGVALASSVVIVLIRRYGERWREQMEREMDR